MSFHTSNPYYGEPSTTSSARNISHGVSSATESSNRVGSRPQRIPDGFDYIDDDGAQDDEDETTAGLTCRIMMTGLPLDEVTERDVTELFQEYLGSGAVRSARLLFGPDGLSLGAAIVTLGRHRDVKRAFSCFNGKVMDGKNPVFIHYLLNLEYPIPRPLQSLIPQPERVASPFGVPVSQSTRGIPSGPRDRNLKAGSKLTVSTPAGAPVPVPRSGASIPAAGPGPKARTSLKSVPSAPKAAVLAANTPRGPKNPGGAHQAQQQSKDAGKGLLGRLEVKLQDRIAGGLGAAGHAGKGPQATGLQSRLGVVAGKGNGNSSPKAQQLQNRLRANPQLQARANAHLQQQQTQLQRGQQQRQLQQAQQQQQRQKALAQAQAKASAATAAPKPRVKSQAELDEELKMVARQRKFEAGGMDMS